MLENILQNTANLALSAEDRHPMTTKCCELGEEQVVEEGFHIHSSSANTGSINITSSTSRYILKWSFHEGS